MKTTGFKVRTNIKAGKCCWDKYNKAKTSGSQTDWNTFMTCCNSDKNCTPADYNLVQQA